MPDDQSDRGGILGDVGVDIEAIEPRSERFEQLSLTAAEQALLTARTAINAVVEWYDEPSVGAAALPCTAAKRCGSFGPIANAP